MVAYLGILQKEPDIRQAMRANGKESVTQYLTSGNRSGYGSPPKVYYLHIPGNYRISFKKTPFLKNESSYLRSIEY